MNKIKPLTFEEIELKEEMKFNCLKRGQYIDEKAEDKFKMLCHLEDFEIQYFDLQERIDEAIERLNTLIEFWKKYNPIDNTMQVEQFKDVINILGGNNE